MAIGPSPNGVIAIHPAVVPDHERAEQLLVQIEQCQDQARRHRLRQEAVELTLDLADVVARRYQGRGVDTEDLVQVGRLALVKAVDNYRCGFGSSFAAYAVPTIAGEIKRYFRDHGWAVRPPRRLQELRAELVVAEDGLRHTLLRDPTEDELARTLAVTVDDLRMARQCSVAYHAVSLDLPATTGSPITRTAVLREDAAERVDRRDALVRAMDELSDRDRLIVRLRFVEERTQSEIGLVLGVSQMQVSRLLAAILRRLRTALVDVPLSA